MAEELPLLDSKTEGYLDMTHAAGIRFSALLQGNG